MHSAAASQQSALAPTHMQRNTQAVDAQEAGIAEVVALLQQPEDLARLPDLLLEYEGKRAANKAALSAVVQSQVGLATSAVCRGLP